VSDQDELKQFPPLLRALLDAELAAGNAVVEIGHAFPSPPVGAWVKLARPVSTRPRRSGDGLTFYDRNGSSYSVEWTDSQGYFFLLEPPVPPPPQPSMDEIRRAANAPSWTPPAAPPTASPEPDIGPGQHYVEIDYRGEMLIYREHDRRADLSCSFNRKPVIARRTLTGWWYPAERRSEAMTAAEQGQVMDRMVAALHRAGMSDVRFEE
jgi:hypothetical protein